MFNKFLLIISGILMLTCAFLMIGHPVSNVLVLGTFISILILVNGILNIISYIRTDKKSDNPWWLLLDGIISLILGLWLILSDAGIVSLTFALPIIVSIWIVFIGIMRIVAAFKLKDLRSDNWWVSLVLGLLAIIAGVVLMFDYTMAFRLTSIIIVIVFFVKGISDIVLGVTLKSR